MSEYAVTTIGDLPVGWVPAGTPALAGQTKPVPGPPRPISSEESVSAPLVALVAIGGALVGALGYWALRKWT